MGEKGRLRLLIVVAVVYAAVYLSMEHNLTIKTAALKHMPVSVVVDAGHGGEDGGAVSVSGVKESTVNLAIALRMEQLLALCGMKPVMVRTSDCSIHTEGDTIHARKVSDLRQRVELVNRQNRAILVSIHQNHFSDPQYSGAQVFYSASGRSKELAQIAQNRLCQTLNPENDRDIKRAETVYLMEQTACTGILVECGFLSNQQESLLLQNPTYQTKIACAVGCALAQFLEEGKDIEI